MRGDLIGFMCILGRLQLPLPLFQDFILPLRVLLHERSAVDLVPENSVDQFECTQLIMIYLRIAGCATQACSIG